MRKVPGLFAAALLILPGIAWARQSNAPTQQSPNAAASPSQQNKSQAASTAAKDQSDSVADAPQDSLAAAARRTKDQKKATVKPAKVFTNDDIPSSGGISSVGKSTEPEEATAAPSGASAKPAAGNDEKTWRDKFAALRQKLEKDQADLDVMQRELGALSVQYYSDPVKAMQQQYSRSDINDKTAQIEAKKKAIDADQQAISDAEDDLRKAGGEPGWAR